MRIMLLYTPRSGSTSIFKYFQESKPEYSCYNEPWFDFMQNNLYKKNIGYEDVLESENLFVKSAVKTLPVSLDQIIKDFDLVIILIRKNTKEQCESYVLAKKERSFLDHSKRIYKTHTISEEEMSQAGERYEYLNKLLINTSEKNKIPLFYYEDLYYGEGFTELFNKLGIEYNEDYFNKYLDQNKRYREGELMGKNEKTII